MKLAPAVFFKKYSMYAMINQIFHGVPASITLSQAALESNWAGSGLTQNANNFFGIKAGSTWTGPVYYASTQEFTGENYITQNSGFRAYSNTYQSFADHSRFLKENQRYSELFNLSKTDYIGWAKGLKSSGYATSPTYDAKLIDLIEKYNLTKYDTTAQLIKYSFIGAALVGLAYLVKIKLIDKG